MQGLIMTYGDQSQKHMQFGFADNQYEVNMVPARTAAIEGVPYTVLVQRLYRLKTTRAYRNCQL